MSVAMLSKRAKTVEVVDDLESFFYVILYYAARYLVSNIGDVPAFIENFFDSYEWVGRAYRVGAMKYNAVEGMSNITISPSDATRVCFSSPLDQVLLTLRNGFHSLYVVRAYNSSQGLLPIAAQPIDKNNLPRTPSKHIFRILGGRAIRREIEDETAVVFAPTEADEKRAKNISDHEYFLALLQKHITVAWPPIYNQGDLIPSNWKSRRDFGPSVTPSNRCTSKRRKLPSHSGIDVVYEEEAEELEDQLEDQLVDQPEEQPVDQPVDQSMDQPVEQPVDPSVDQPVEQLVEAVDQLTEKPAGKKRRALASKVHQEGVRRSARLANKV